MNGVIVFSGGPRFLSCRRRIFLKCKHSLRIRFKLIMPIVGSATRRTKCRRPASRYHLESVSAMWTNPIYWLQSSCLSAGQSSCFTVLVKVSGPITKLTMVFSTIFLECLSSICAHQCYCRSFCHA
jgi:hypothetical protein